MPHTFGILSILPPLLSIAFALWKKKIIPSLFFGVYLGEIIVAGWDPFTGFFRLLDHGVDVLGKPDNLQLVLFSALVGGMLELIRRSNGFTGFIRWLDRLSFGRNRLGIYFLTFTTGLLLFLENWSNVLVNGTTMGPLYDRHNISRQRLAYFIHTISINTVAIVLINSWGAFYMTLLQAQDVAHPFALMLSALPYNFYCIVSLLMVTLVMATGWNIGPMRRSEQRVAEEKRKWECDKREATAEASGVPPSLLHLFLPLLILVAGVFIALYVTGSGNMIRGSGSTSVFYAVVSATLALGMYLVIRRHMKPSETAQAVGEGIRSFLPITLLILFALMLGELCKMLGTGNYIASVAEASLPAAFIPALVFVIGAVISFATGTSYGTFAIMTPIALTIAQAIGLPAPLMFAASISGGVFGDNCSLISDTTIVTSVAAKVSVVEHVKTQLPYALIAAAVAAACFLVAGLMMTI